MDLKQMVGETSEYDKKQALEEKRPKSWLKSVSAFANSFGGKLFFGISDNDEIVGLSDAQDDAEKISEAIKMHMNPIPASRLEMPDYPDRAYMEALVNALIHRNYLELGSGFKKILDAYSSYERKTVFLSEHWGFTITFPNVNYDSETTQDDSLIVQDDRINDRINFSETTINRAIKNCGKMD